MTEKKYFLNLLLFPFFNDEMLKKSIKILKSRDYEGKEKEARDLIVHTLKAFRIDRNYTPYAEHTLAAGLMILIADGKKPLYILNFLNDHATNKEKREEEDGQELAMIITEGYSDRIEYLDRLIAGEKDKLHTLTSSAGVHAIQYDRKPGEPQPEYDKTARLAIKSDALKYRIKDLEERKAQLLELNRKRQAWLNTLGAKQKRTLYSSEKPNPERFELLLDFKKAMLS